MHSGCCQLAVFVNLKPKPMGDIMREEKRSKEKRRWIKFKLNCIVLLGLIFVNLKLLGLFFANQNAELSIQRKLSIVNKISMFLNIST
jgi:hypothetical protein